MIFDLNIARKTLAVIAVAVLIGSTGCEDKKAASPTNKDSVSPTVNKAVTKGKGPEGRGAEAVTGGGFKQGE